METRKRRIGVGLEPILPVKSGKTSPSNDAGQNTAVDENDVVIQKPVTQIIVKNGNKEFKLVCSEKTSEFGKEFVDLLKKTFQQIYVDLT